MASVNKVILVGNLGADPDVKTFDNGGMIANVSIATSERWTDKQTGEMRENTEWHKVVFNDRLAQIVSQYLRKGSSVYVEGSLRTRKWTDNSGVERYITEVRAMSMQMLGGRSDSVGGARTQSTMTGNQYTAEGYGKQNNNNNNNMFGNPRLHQNQNAPVSYQQNRQQDEESNGQGFYGHDEQSLQSNQPQRLSQMTDGQSVDDGDIPF